MRVGDTVKQLKERIAAKCNFPVDRLHIFLEFTFLASSRTMKGCRLSAGSVVTAKVSSRIEFQYQARTVTKEAHAGQSLKEMLLRVSKMLNEQPSKLLYSFVKSSGAIAGNASKWLEDRTNLFAAERAVGSWDENGLRDGDQIKVHRLQEEMEVKPPAPKKRKR